MGNKIEKLSFQCQESGCDKAIEYYDSSVKKCFWETCASNNIVDDESAKVPNPLEVYKKIVISKQLYFTLHWRSKEKYINKLALNSSMIKAFYLIFLKVKNSFLEP